MTQLSRERLEEIKYRTEMYGNGAGYLPEEILSMVDRLLAAEAQEPVGEIVLGDYDDCGDHPDAKVVCIAAQGRANWSNFRDGTKLYAAPQPVAAPDDLSNKSLEHIANKFQVSISDAQWILIGWKACRTAPQEATK